MRSFTPRRTTGAHVDQTSSSVDERRLTDNLTARVKALVAATCPSATVVRVETDSDGVYEAHLELADGSQRIVPLGQDFALTGAQAGDAQPVASRAMSDSPHADRRRPDSS
jgi:hypothetical protein